MNKLEKEINRTNLLAKLERIIFIVLEISMTLLCLTLIVAVILYFI